MLRWITSFAVAAMMSAPALAVEVWKSTFDTDADGVVDIYDSNPSKVMIGANTGGKLTITAEDSVSFAETDRVGRPLGATIDGHSEYSGLITYMYDTLPQTGDNWSFLGFSGSGGSNPGIARKVSGVIMRHTFSGGNYFVQPALQWGSSSGQDRTKFTGAINLGPNPFAQTYQLAISYLGDFNGLNNSFDTGTGMMRADLYDGGGNLLGSIVQSNVTAGDGGGQVALLTGLGGEPGSYPTFLSNQALTHLGAMDYRAFGQANDVVYLFDSLAYYDGFGDALDSVVPEPASGLVLLAGAALLGMRRRRAA